MDSYDMIVIGAGAAGLVVSAGAASLGARVALVERDRLGGECLWTGCVPSQALGACAYAYRLVRTSQRFGVGTRDVRLDLGSALHWVREAQRRLEPQSGAERLRAAGVEVVEGSARFDGARSIVVDGRQLSARTIVLATGSRPALPPVAGLDVVPFFTNETIFDIDYLPETLLVLGGGTAGLELAQTFARFGSTVKVIEESPVLLPNEDRELADRLSARLAREGVEILVNHRATSVAGSSDRVVLTVQAESGPQRVLMGNALVVATGRIANVVELELDRPGVEVGRDGIVVDDYLRTTARGIFAAGDVIGEPRFAHVAAYEARVVLRNALLPLRRKRNYALVPWVTFTDPTLAHVGLTEEQARARHGSAVRVWRRPFDRVDRAVADGDTDGMVKLVTDRRGRLLGGHILGRGAGDMIGTVGVAMSGGISATQLARTLQPYPSYPEAIREAADDFVQTTFAGLARGVVRLWLRR